MNWTARIWSGSPSAPTLQLEFLIQTPTTMTKDQARNHYKELRARVMGAEAQGLKPKLDDLMMLKFEELLDEPNQFFVMVSIEIANEDAKKRPFQKETIEHE